MKKTIAVVLSIILLMETTACHSYMDLTSLQEFEANKENPNISVLQLQTDQFEMINFSEKYPGRLLKDEVVGIHQVLLYKFNSDSVIYKSKTNLTPICAIKDEVRYRIINESSKSLVYISSDTLHIPLSDIKKMHIKKIEQAKSLLLIVGIVAGAAGLIYLAVINMTFDLDLGGI